MPIVWRYLLGEYLKVFFLCLVSFIAILLTTRLDEIAHFATLGSEGLLVLWFTIHQIPYILPIAIPISSLISVIILVQRLSGSHELTAFRACGLSLREIITPLLIAGFFISAANFYIVSELATQSHLQTGLTKMELRSINPLLLLHNKHLMRLKGIYSDTLGNSRIGEHAGDIIIAMPNKNNGQMNLIAARNLEANADNFLGEKVTVITPLNNNSTGKYDQLMIENMGRMETSLNDFSQILQKKVWTLNNDHLRLSLLRARIKELKQLEANLEKTNENAAARKQLQRNINKSYAEIIRRISISLAALTFTLMGAAFGISISRNRSNKGLIFVIGFASLYIVSFFAAKGLDQQLLAASLLYLAPLCIIVISSIWMLRRISKGIES